MSSSLFSQPQFYALQDLFISTNGWNWTWSEFGGNEWNFSDPSLNNPCTDSWQGITCFGTTSISIITLANFNMKGSLPDTVGQLNTLFIVDFSQNSLTGSIPWQLSNLTGMFQLELDNNQLEGEFPVELWQLSGLSYLDLSVNNLHGPLPDIFGNFSGMFYLALSNNYFSHTLPSSLGKLTGLNILDLSSNLFNGEIPSLLNLNSLSSLELCVNEFSGTLQNWGMSNKSHINTFDVHHNQFTGKMQQQIKWSRLNQYYIDINFITGSIGCSIASSQQISELGISFNIIEGSIPQCLSNAQRMGVFNAQSNILTGTLPVSILQEWTMELSALYIDNNYFEGTIPDVISNITALFAFTASYNNFIGSFPASMSRLPYLAELLVEGNKLSGQLAVSLEKGFTNLQIADFSDNEFTGPIPEGVFVNSLSLQTFAIASNCFSGTLPKSICNATRLIALSLDGLSTSQSCRRKIFEGMLSFDAFSLKKVISGTIPTCYFTMPRLQVLHLSGNDIKDTLSNHISFEPRLIYLSLSHNKLSGTIPPSLMNRYWENLDLSYNRFTGDLSELSTISFAGFNSSLSLEVNRLSGTVPEVLWNAHNITILNGNIFECNFHRSDLPRHDKDHAIYSCGSDDVNNALYMWVGFWFVPLVVWLLIESEIIRRNRASTISSSRAPSSDSSLSINSLGIVEAVRQENTQRVSSIEMSKSIKSSAQASQASQVSAIKWGWGIFRYRSIFVWQSIFAQFKYRAISQNHSLTSFLTNLNAQYAEQYCYSSCYVFHKTMDQVRYLAFSITAFIVVVFFPLFGSLSHFSPSYKYQYAWEVSAAFVSGQNVAIAFAVCFGIFIVFVAAQFQNTIWYLDLTNNVVFTNNVESKESCCERDDINRNEDMSYGTEKVDTIISDEDRESSTISRLNNNNKISEVQKDTVATPNYCTDGFLYLAWTIAFILNLGVMLSLDSIYIYIVLNFSTSTITFAQIGLALGKLLWNETLVFHLLYYLKAFLKSASQFRFKAQHDVSSSEEQLASSSSEQYLYASKLSVRDVTALCIISIVNKLVAPCIAISLINSNCFYNALFAAPAVTANIEYCNANVVDLACVNVLASGKDGRTYDPPFLYSFQCSSFFVADYVPVFVYMFAFSSVMVPFVLFCLQNLHDSLADDILYAEFRRSGFGTNDRRGTLAPNEQDFGAWSRYLYKLLSDWLPQTWQCPHSVSTSKEENNSKWIMIVNTKQRTSIRINNHFAILVSFAACFPPLAVVALISICILTYFEERNSSRLLNHANVFNKKWLAERIEKESVGITNSFRYTMALMVVLAACLFSVFLFDTLGDESGWVAGVCLAVPFCFLAVVTWMMFLGYYRNKKLRVEKEPPNVELYTFKNSSVAECDSITFVNPLVSEKVMSKMQNAK